MTHLITNSRLINTTTEDEYQLPSGSIDSKDYNRTRYAMKKRTPGRFSDSLKRERKTRFIKRCLKKMHENVPHSSPMEHLDGFLTDIRKYVRLVERNPLKTTQVLLHVENLGIFLYSLFHAKTMDMIVISVVNYMKCYLKKVSVIELLSRIHFYLDKTHPNLPVTETKDHFDREDLKIADLNDLQCCIARGRKPKYRKATLKRLDEEKHPHEVIKDCFVANLYASMVNTPQRHFVLKQTDFNYYFPPGMCWETYKECYKAYNHLEDGEMDMIQAQQAYDIYLEYYGEAQYLDMSMEEFIEYWDRIYSPYYLNTANFTKIREAAIERHKERCANQDMDYSTFFDEEEEERKPPAVETVGGEDVHIPHSASWNASALKETWNLLKAHPMYEKICFLLTYALTGPLQQDFSIDFRGVKLIHLEAMKHQVSSFDLIDATINTFSWLLDTGAACISEGSLAPLLYDDQKMRAYSREYSDIVSLADSMTAGNLPIDGSCDDDIYERRLTDLISETMQYQEAAKSSIIREVFSKKFILLRKIKVDMINKRKNTLYREAPFAVSIYGESSIGKSDISQIVMTTILVACNQTIDPKYQITINEADEYDSTYTTDIKGVFIDDAANASSAFVQKAPTSKYLQLINNIPACAVKAELESKGNVFYCPTAVVATTNVKKLDANLYSNYPIAILRRFVHITARVKPEYCVPGGKSLNLQHPDILAAKPGEFVDCWEFDIQEAIPDGSTMGKFKTVVYFDGVTNVLCANLGLQRMVQAIAHLAEKHDLNQKKQVRRNVELRKTGICKACKNLPQFCKCAQFVVPHSVSSVVADIVCSGLRTSIQRKISDLCDKWFIFKAPTHVADMCVSSYLSYGLRYFPKSWTCNSVVRPLLFDYHVRTVCPRARVVHRHVSHCILYFAFILCIFIYCNSFICVILTSCIMFLLSFILFSCEVNFEEERRSISQYVEENSATVLTTVCSKLQENWSKIFVGAGATLLLVASSLKLWNTFRKNPHGLSDFKDFDQQPGWFGHVLGFSGSKNCKSNIVGANAQHFTSALQRNLRWCRYKQSDGHVDKCCIFFPRKSVALFPKHIFHREGNMKLPPSPTLECEVISSNKPGGRYTFKVSRSLCYVFPDSDLVACYVPNCPDVASRLDWFPKLLPSGGTMGVLMALNEDLEFTNDPLHVTFGRVKHTYMEMFGGHYTTSLAKSGACMSVLISDNKQPAIVGFHIGGNSLTQHGICVTISSEMLHQAIEYLESNVSYLSAESGVIPQTLMGKQVLSSPKVNSKALFINDMDSSYEVEVLGSTQLRSEQKTTVVPSILSPHVAEVCGIPNEWAGPMLKPNWRPYNANVDKFAKPGAQFDPVLLRRACDDWIKPLRPAMERWREWENSYMRPLTLEENIMGIPGIRFIEPIPMNTGMGFPVFGKKKLHFEEVREGEKLLSRTPSSDIMEEVERMLSCYKKNERAYPVVSATLKDEPTKIGKEKVRVFQAAPIALGILIRKYFLPVARFLCTHPLLAELAVGVNAFSTDWEELMAHALKYSENDEVLGWDYSSYDVRMNSQVTRAVWNLFIDIAALGYYTEEDLAVMKAMVVDITHPLIDLNGTMLMAFAMNTSGNNMTVYVNSVAGSLYVRMGYFHMFPLDANFRDHVALLTYGDDGICSRSSSRREFNFISYKRFLEDHGMKLTLPTKTEDEFETLGTGECDFLKRMSVDVPEIGHAIGALDESSIFKSLHCNLKSSAVTSREVATSCIEGAMHEWFAHGREKYELRANQMQEVCRRAGLVVPAVNISFDERVAHWKEKYLTKPQSSSEESPLDTSQDVDLALANLLYTYLCGGGITSPNPLSLPDNNNTHLIGSSNSSADERRSGPNGHVSEVGENTRDSHSPHCVAPDTFPQPISRPPRTHPPTLGTIYHQVRCAQGILNSLERNIQDFLVASVEDELQHVRRMTVHLEDDVVSPQLTSLSGQFDDVIEPQSAMEHPMADSDDADAHAETPNVHFTDAHPGFHDQRGQKMDPLRVSIPDEEVALDRFFERPLKIREFTWNINSNINQDFDPWALFFENKRVINKISNYRLMSATLHVKFLLNGTGLHYGRALVSYRPLDDFDALTDTTTSQNSLCLASQRPHLYLNPTISQGGCLTLPFFTPYNMLDITIAQWRQMGRINIDALTTLKHATGSSTPITISVFAWATNVILSGLTTQNPAFIVPQSASEYSGIISKPASAVSKVASIVKDIPILSNFAMATEIGANSIAYMANYFGFSKPPGMHPSTMMIVSNDNSINCDGRKQLHKLTMDSKQELTVDPIVAGLESVDEMTIASIATRESYLTRFSWEVADPPEKLLFNIVVDPGVIRWTSAWTSEIAMTSLGFAATPFQYWRGSLRYRFQVVSSSFHSGRLKIVWDPFGTPFGGSDYNTAYTQIVDVSENNDFVVQTGWGQSTTWRQVMQTQQPPNYAYSPTQLGEDAARVPYNGANVLDIGNGTLCVYVMNSLITPDSSIDNDVVVLVSVSAADDIEFCVPSEDIRGFQLNLAPTSAHELSGDFLNRVPSLQFPGLDNEVLPQSASDAEQRTQAVGLADVKGNPTQQTTTLTMGPPPIMDSLINKIYMGESIVSFRTLLKRYNAHEFLVPRASSTPAGPNRISFVRRNFPFYSGHTNALPGVNLVETFPSGNAIQGLNTLLNYLGPAYGGWRGGIRYLIDTSLNYGSIAVPSAIHINMLATNEGANGVRTDYNDGPNQFLTTVNDRVHRTLAYKLQNVQSGFPISDRVNPIHSFEIPYQTQYRFCPSRRGIEAGTNKFQSRWEMEIYTNMTVNSTSFFQKWVAAGEDFNFLFYLGPPILYYRPTQLPP